MNFVLTLEEVRVIGCLMEKAVTTPDQYPLTLNALTNACNQKSSRSPVMKLEVGVVQRTTRQLEEKYLLSKRDGAMSNVEKYTQRLCNTPMAKLQISPAEYALVCLLLLRGPQTPGELRSRSGRLHRFADNQEVKDILEGFMAREEGPVVVRLPRVQGRQDHQYMHPFAGEIDSVQEEPGLAQRAPSNRDSRIEQLETRIVVLEKALQMLAEKLGEEIDLDGPV